MVMVMDSDDCQNFEYKSMVSSRKSADVSKWIIIEFFAQFNHMSLLIIVPSEFRQCLLEVK